MVTINNRDPRPIYEQISDSIKRLIISGVLAQDEKLPSVRELAGTLAINPNTIQRAYRQLEAEGWCYSVPGKGSFAGSGRRQDAQRIEQLLLTLRETVSELLYLGVSRSEIQSCLAAEGGDQA